MKMLVTSAFVRDPERLATLERQHDMQFVVPAGDDSSAPLMGDVDAVYGHLTADEFAKARQLRWVQAPGAGVEWMWQVPGLADSGVVVTNMRGAHAATIADHAFAMLLTHTRGLRRYAELQRDHHWDRFQPGVQPGLHALKDMTLGIVGFGNIGRAIARRANGFEMRVLAVDAETVPAGEGVAEVWPLSRLNELCQAADVLIVAAPITPSSRGMIGPEQIRRLKRGSFLLSMSRGGIVDEPGLVDALEEGHLAGAALDVTATEPLPTGDPLWTAPNLIITPHMSALSQLTRELTWSILSDNLGRFLRGEPLTNLVDKRRGY
jgi:phosphoglycerate dehydrogenase-like enzyme